MATVELGSGREPKTGTTVVVLGQNTVVQKEATDTRLHKAGQFAWSLLHKYRGCDPQWIELWEYFIPAGSCNCKEGYKAILKDYPPDFSSPEAFFAWGVALHNAVNRKIGKPEMTLDEARKLWRGDDGLDAESKQ